MFNYVDTPDRQKCFNRKCNIQEFIRNHIRDSGGVFSISSLVKISMISLISGLSLKLYLNSFVYYRKTSSGLPRKSSAIFRNLRTSSGIFGNSRKMFGNVYLAFGPILENLWKPLESSWKCSENHLKHPHQYVYILKRTLHVSPKIWILCSRG